ncbi:MAG: DinB family protein [Gemmatimonadetes bacterium]|nr:DinB family protein [Gemmatimonadota bacterium]
MLSTELQTLLAYNHWANALTFDAADALTEAQRREPIVSSFPSVAATLAHMAGAEWVWLRRWKGESPSAVPEWVREADIATVRAQLAEIERERDEYLASLSADDVEREVEYRTLSGAAGRTKLSDLIRHVVNHASYHRGQVTTMLRQLGATPPGTDYVLYLRVRG